MPHAACPIGWRTPTSNGASSTLLPDPLTVLPAYNPGTERLGRDRNEEANLRLAAILLARGHRFHAATGYSPDRSHSEPSYGVESLTRSAAQELGNLFGQACVFHWE
jgi:hypothetical protein